MKKIFRKLQIGMLIFLFLFNTFLIPTEAKKDLITDGKGIWVNIWNYPENPALYCEYLQEHDINTVYLQISRSNTPAIKHPEKLNEILKEAHKRNIKIIGWTYPFLKDPVADAEKFITAAKYTSPEGERLDSIASDIEEVTDQKSISKYSSRIRSKMGSDFELIAITFSPVLKRANPKHYAWKTIADNFDILCPMTYWTWNKEYRSEKGAYQYTANTIKLIKEYTNNPNVRIHLIGDGQKTSLEELSGFLKAASDNGVKGVSIYPMYKPTIAQVKLLNKFRI